VSCFAVIHILMLQLTYKIQLAAIHVDHRLDFDYSSEFFLSKCISPKFYRYLTISYDNLNLFQSLLKKTSLFSLTNMRTQPIFPLP
jgi:hypothetical protein